jgi:hypothetical protein
VLYVMKLGRYADEYWAMVLPATYPCYVMTALAQTLPPRMLEVEQAPNERPGLIRRFNLRILHRASIQVNTFPSAHVASTVAASLALLGVAPPVPLPLRG